MEVFTSKATQLPTLALYHDPFYIFAQSSPAPHRIRNWKSRTKLSFAKAFQKAVNTLQFSLQHSLFSFLLLAKMSDMYLLANRGNGNIFKDEGIRLDKGTVPKLLRARYQESRFITESNYRCFPHCEEPEDPEYTGNLHLNWFSG